MSQPGMGMMISWMEGNAESVEALKEAIGQKIMHLEVLDKAIKFTFESSFKMMLVDDGQSCCEVRYFTCDDKLDPFVGAELLNVEQEDVPGKEEDGEMHEQSFLLVTTSRGVFTVCAHNEHNGYYGGFAIKAEKL